MDHRYNGAYAVDSAALITDLLEATNDLVAAIDARYRFVAFNAAFSAEFARAFGTPPKLGQPVDEALAHVTGDRDKVIGLSRRALAGESFVVEEEFGIGEQRKWYELRFSPIVGSEGRAIIAAIVVRDMTERHIAEGRFTALLEAAPDAMLIMRPDGTIHRINSLAERMFGYGKGELEGKPLEWLVPQRLREAHVRHRHSFLMHAGTRPMGAGIADLVGRRADGTEFPVQISLNPLPMGTETLVAAAVRDQTEQKHALEVLEQRVAERTADLQNAVEQLRQLNAQLQDSQGKLLLAQQVAGVGTFEWDIQGDRHRWSPELESLYGLPVGGFEGTHEAWSKRVHPDDRAEAERRLRESLEQGTFEAEWRVTRPDGTVKWLAARGLVYRSEDGRAHRMLGANIDITQRKQAELALRGSEAELRATFEQAAVGIAHLSIAESRFLRANDALCRFTGYSREEMFALTSLDVTYPEDREVGAAQYAQLVAGAMPSFTMEKRFVRKDGRVLWGRSSLSVVHGEDGPSYIINIIEDITEARQADLARVETERRLQLAVGIAELGFWEWDVAINWVYFSPIYKKQLGYEDHELPNRIEEWRSRLHPEDRERVLEGLAHFIENPGAEVEKEYRLRHRDGSYRWVLSRGIPVRTTGGRVEKLIGTHLDVTDRKLSEERIREAALHDVLTGLPNRALVFDYTNRLLAAAKRSHSRGAVVFVDLDRFKPINDTYGHEVGDQLLRAVAERLVRCTREEDIVGRMGGDEFVIVLSYLDGSYRAARVAEHVLDSLNRPFKIGSLELSISSSIGISVYPQHGTDVDTLIRGADLAMYAAKQSGGASYHVYTPELDRQADDVLALETTLKRALAHDELVLFYQPVVDIHSGGAIGAEALLRLPMGGDIVGPGRFIPVAESSGLIGQLGEWVAAEACRQHEEWLDQGLPPVMIAINVSPLQFRQKQFSERLAEIVRDAGIDPAYLQIEVTESAVMENVQDAIEILHKIKFLGVKVALDDFGTGYSSLSHLSTLPLDKLKVDQSFVRRLDHDRASRAITEAIIALGWTLKLEVVGEGIESEEALEYLRQHGCDQAQGFLFSQPLPAAEFARWYAASRALREGKIEGAGEAGPMRQNMGNLGVLVVDDQPANLQLVQAMLADLELNVVPARGGIEAIEKAQQRDFGLVLMDIRMPGMDGIETAKRLRELPRHTHTPIIFMTAHSPEDQEITGGYQAGAVDYLFKPLTPQVLRAKVSAFADLYRKHQELKITAAREAQYRQLQRDMAELEQVANYDALTGLANRKLLMDRLEQDLAHCARHGERLALLFLDLDRFKQINDSLGHHVGDEVLRQAAARLRESVRKDDLVGRVGGDEFLVLLTGIEELTPVEHLVRVVEKCTARVARPFHVMDHELHVTVSAGVSIFPEDGRDGPTLLRNADLAMYRAKDHGRNNYHFYDEEMSQRVQQRMDTENALRQAIDNDELVLRYQPKLDLATRRLSSAEALLRWQRGGRLVSPREFIGVAEESGLLVPIGHWVLRTACLQIKEWDALGLPPLRVAVNLSLRQLQNRFVVTDVERVLHECGVEAGRLELEISEADAMLDVAQTGAAVERLREMGVHLALDDFGMGYSSLKYLKSLRFETLKIDRTFIRDLSDNDQDLAITRTIIGMARSLGMNTIAEGVETRDQLGILGTEGCDTIQGYLVSPPVRGRELAQVLDRERELVGELLGA